MSFKRGFGGIFPTPLTIAPAASFVGACSPTLASYSTLPAALASCPKVATRGERREGCLTATPPPPTNPKPSTTLSAERASLDTVRGGLPARLNVCAATAGTATLQLVPVPDSLLPMRRREALEFVADVGVRVPRMGKCPCGLTGAPCASCW